MEEKEKTVETIATEINLKIDNIKSNIVTDFEKKHSELEKANAELKQKSEKLEHSLEILTTDFENVKKNEREGMMTIKESILDFFKSNNIKNIHDLRNIQGREYELKANTQVITTDYTGDVSRSQIVSDVRFANEAAFSFVNKLTAGGILADGKSILVWIPATISDAVGYIGEYTDATGVNLSDGTATEKYRKMAKIVARMTISAETFEDLDQFASRLEQKLIEKVLKFIDGEILRGIGADVTYPNNIYGIVPNQSTAFVPTGYETESPNIADLIAAMATQARIANHTPNTVWMSPKLFYHLRGAKDLNGNYIVESANEAYYISGLEIVQNVNMEAGNPVKQTLLVGDISLIQMWTKRNLTAEVERDAKMDGYNLYLYWRGQVLVEDEDIKGLIYCSDMSEALDSITIE